jgi:hypothetical protein
MAQKSEFRAADRKAYWFVELPPDRPTRRTCSRKRWLKIVNAEIERDEHGNPIHREWTMEGVVVMRVDDNDTRAWKEFLGRIIHQNAFRMFWEPQPPREPRRPGPDLFAD